MSWDRRFFWFPTANGGGCLSLIINMVLMIVYLFMVIAVFVLLGMSLLALAMIFSPCILLFLVL